jgi:hypothetical protein
MNKKNKSNFIGDVDYFDISNIMNRYQKNNNNIEENMIYSKNKKNLNRNISAKYINRNREKILFNNNSTIDTKNKINSGLIKNMRKQEINSYNNKNNKLRNHSTKVTGEKQLSNNYYNIQYSNKNINIPKTKRDYLGKDIIRNDKSLYYRNNNSMYTTKKIKKKRLSSSNSMKNLYANNFMIKEQINNNISMNKSKSNLFDSINSSRISRYIPNFDKKLPFLSFSINKKNENENNNDIYFNKNINDKTNNGINYDYLMEKIKNKKIKNGNNSGI